MVSTRRSSANAVAKETQPMVRSIRDRHRTEALARGNPKFGPPHLRSRKVPRGPCWFSQIWDPRGGPGGANEARAPLFIAPGCLESHQRRSGTLACSASRGI